MVKATRTIRGVAPQSMERTTTLEAEWLEEVAAVDSATSSRAAEVRLTIERWARRDVGPDDDSLTGREVTLRPLLRGDARVEVAGPAPSPSALAFLARVADRLRACPHDVALRPDRPVKVGQAWRPRGLAGLVFDAPFVDVDEARSEGECTLRALGERADVRLAARLRLLTVPGTRARVADGGDYHLQVEASFAPAQRPSRGRIREVARFEARAHGQLPDGTPFDLTTEARLEGVVEVRAP